MWDEFKRVLSVAHASQPVERIENLEYRNQLSGVCWGAVYSSIEFIFLNHPVYLLGRGTAGLSYERFLATRYTYKPPTYIQEPLVICRRGNLQRDLNGKNG